jgi:hypothetical protein
MFRDIDDDGRVETLFSLQTRDDLREGTLFCFGEGGLEKWRFDAGRELVFGGKPYRKEYRIRGFDLADVDGDGTIEIFVISTQKPDWPCQFAVLDTRGAVKSEFWNSGYLTDAEFGDIDGDGSRDAVLSGINNEYKTGCVAVFRGGRIAGSSPQQDPVFQCPDLPPRKRNGLRPDPDLRRRQIVQ